MLSNFMECCLNGEALPEEINNYIDAWHETETDLELHEFLGLTYDEYAAYAVDRNALSFIINARLEKRNFRDLIEESQSYVIAARSSDAKDTKGLTEWLHNSEVL